VVHDHRHGDRSALLTAVNQKVAHRQTAPGPFALGAVLFIVIPMMAAHALGQRGPVHYFHSGDLPPGAIGQGQLLRGGPLPGYFQPVEIKAPKGAAISMAVDGRFEPPREAPILVGLLIGQVYRFKITSIPHNEGFEVFPTIEMVNRLYPPRGLENHFPVPIEFTLEELKLALTGRFVTRVIYLEDPKTALPIAENPDRQRYYEVRSDQDPLKVADRLGRPMAIMRMGSRTPDFDAVSNRFTFGTPPLRMLTRPAPLPDPKSGLEEPLQPPAGSQVRNIPRIPSPIAPPGTVTRPAVWWVR